jgi:KaiC/GvpD/RAD55 family RecA-like ATPase
MFHDLNDFLDLSPGRLANGLAITVVESDNSDASFLLHHFISLYLKLGHNVCLVALAQSFNHYSCVANKLGFSLKAFRESGQFAIVEGLKCIGADIMENSTTVESSTKMESSSPLCPRLGCSNSRDCLKNLFLKIKEALQSIPTLNVVSSSVLIVDDLSILTSLGFSDAEVATFVQYLRGLMCPRTDSLGALVMLVHYGEGEEGVCTKVAHQSDVVARVGALRTGYCRDVHGELTVEWRKIHQNQASTNVRSVHYKITDKKLQLFPPGTSAAVL